MNKTILVLLILVIFTGDVVAQQRKKNREEKAVSDSTAQMSVAVHPTEPVAVPAMAVETVADSLKRSAERDSINAQLTLYKNFYTHISNKFFPEEFKNIEIEKAIPLADSLSAANQSASKGLQSLSNRKIDSLSYLLKTADTLRMENQVFKALLISLIGENVYPLNETELKGSWQVFVQPLQVTGSGQESAIVSLEKIVLADSVYKFAIKQIVFLEEDLADIYFFGGKKTKCFYKVTGFSRDKTYSISLQKGDEINIKLFVTPVPRGLQISYKVGLDAGKYMFGFMRK
jgi:hypothetical protein